MTEPSWRDRYTLKHDYSEELALAVGCSYCGAKQGHRCTTRKRTTRWYNGGLSTRKWWTAPHSARWDEAQAFIDRHVVIYKKLVKHTQPS